MRWSTPEFYLKTRDEMMAAVRRSWSTRRPHLGHRAALPRQAGKGRGAVPALRHPGRAHHRYLLRIRRARRVSRSAARAWKRMQAKGALKHDLAEYAERLDREIKMIQQMKFSGYFLIVWDFIRYAKATGHSGGPGPRFGRRQPGQLRDGDHRHRSAAVRPAVRALPQSRAHQHARYRHRFLHERAAAK